MPMLPSMHQFEGDRKQKLNLKTHKGAASDSTSQYISMKLVRINLRTLKAISDHLAQTYPDRGYTPAMVKQSTVNIRFGVKVWVGDLIKLFIEKQDLVDSVSIINGRINELNQAIASQPSAPTINYGFNFDDTETVMLGGGPDQDIIVDHSDFGTETQYYNKGHITRLENARAMLTTRYEDCYIVKILVDFYQKPYEQLVTDILELCSYGFELLATKLQSETLIADIKHIAIGFLLAGFSRVCFDLQVTTLLGPNQGPQCGSRLYLLIKRCYDQGTDWLIKSQHIKGHDDLIYKPMLALMALGKGPKKIKKYIDSHLHDPLAILIGGQSMSCCMGMGDILDANYAAANYFLIYLCTAQTQVQSLDSPSELVVSVPTYVEHDLVIEV